MLRRFGPSGLLRLTAMVPNSPSNRTAPSFFAVTVMYAPGWPLRPDGGFRRLVAPRYVPSSRMMVSPGLAIESSVPSLAGEPSVVPVPLASGPA